MAARQTSGLPVSKKKTTKETIYDVYLHSGVVNSAFAECAQILLYCFNCFYYITEKPPVRVLNVTIASLTTVVGC